MAKNESARAKRRRQRRRKVAFLRCLIIIILALIVAGGILFWQQKKINEVKKAGISTAATENATEAAPETEMPETEEALPTETVTEEVTEEVTETEEAAKTSEAENTAAALPASEQVYWSDSFAYASNSKVHEDSVTLYHADASVRNGITVAVNAGHGSTSAASVKTLCHPDGSAKVTGGSTASGSTTATGANGGTTFLDGTSEASVNLQVALQLKDVLLTKGYDVLMLREASDCDMDNIARSVYANNYADCHIAIHYDSTENDKGLFYTAVPNVSSYRSMEPVASTWQKDEALGQALLAGAKADGIKIYSSGAVALDLTQTSYSSVPSVDLEVGDRGSDHSTATTSKIAQAIADGVDVYFGK